MKQVFKAHRLCEQGGPLGSVSTGLIGGQHHQNQRRQGTILDGSGQTDATPSRWERGGLSGASSLRAVWLPHGDNLPAPSTGAGTFESQLCLESGLTDSITR